MNGGRGETIFALATGVGRAGVAVIRVSGPAAAGALERVAGRVPPLPRRMVRARLVAPGDNDPLDDGLVVWFPGPDSFTGEDVAEFHVHGGRATVAGLLEALGAGANTRLAEPGEFTRRAFENGKLDLTAAEGLADLVAAETAAQRRQAVRQLRGELGALYEGWRQRLLRTMAHLEATIDFSDEDLPAGLSGEVAREVGRLRREMADHLGDGRRGEQLREGVHVAIVGPPNGGKSSLLNFFARREAAIVAATAGTTRDVIEIRLEINGYPLVVADTAGMRGTARGVEAEGVRRAVARAEEADLKLVVLDAQLWPTVDGPVAALVDENALVVINKCDLGAPPPPLRIGGKKAFLVSVLTGEGLEDVVAALGGAAAERCGGGDLPALTRVRHRQAVEDCLRSLTRFSQGPGIELAAEDLRLAARAMGRITGRVDVEDILDVIFRDFCIGK